MCEEGRGKREDYRGSRDALSLYHKLRTQAQVYADTL